MTNRNSDNDDHDRDRDFQTDALYTYSLKQNREMRGRAIVIMPRCARRLLIVHLDHPDGQEQSFHLGLVQNFGRVFQETARLQFFSSKRRAAAEPGGGASHILVRWRLLAIAQRTPHGLQIQGPVEQTLFGLLNDKLNLA